MADDNVAVPAGSLKALLSPVEPARFLSENYLHKPLHIPGDAGRFSHLLSWDGLNQATTRQRPRRVPLRLAKDGKLVPQDEYATRETNAAGDIWHVKFRTVRRLLEEGATLLIDRIDERHEPLADFCRMLEPELGSYAFADAFASWHQRQGFATHWDPEQVFVLQLVGTKRWRVFKPERLYPTQQDKSRKDQPPSEPYWEGDMKAGDLLYIPGGWWHDALAVSGPTLHVSLSLHAATGFTALKTMLAELQEDELARAPLPRFATETEQQHYMSRLRSAVDTKMRGLTVKSLLERMDANAPARNRLSLPWSWAAENETIPSHAWIHWLPPRSVAVKETGEEFSFESMGNRFALGIDHLPVIRDMIERRKLRFSELCSRHPQLPIEKILLQLVSLGLIAIADDSVI